MEYEEVPIGKACCNVCLFCPCYIILLTSSLLAHPWSLHSISAVTQVCLVWLFQDSIYTLIPFSLEHAVWGVSPRAITFTIFCQVTSFNILSSTPGLCLLPWVFVLFASLSPQSVGNSGAPMLFQLLRVLTYIHLQVFPENRHPTGNHSTFMKTLLLICVWTLFVTHGL